MVALSILGSRVRGNDASTLPHRASPANVASLPSRPFAPRKGRPPFLPVTLTLALSHRGRGDGYPPAVALLPRPPARSEGG